MAPLSPWIAQPTPNTWAHRHGPAFQRKATADFPSVTFPPGPVRRVSPENPPVASGLARWGHRSTATFMAMLSPLLRLLSW